MQRNREAWTQAPDEMPVFGTIAPRFNDDGVSDAHQALLVMLQYRGQRTIKQQLAKVDLRTPSEQSLVVPADRQC